MTGAGLHILDALVNLAGPVAEVDARLFVHKPAPDPRDATAALLQFKSGATGHEPWHSCMKYGTCMLCDTEGSWAIASLWFSSARAPAANRCANG